MATVLLVGDDRNRTRGVRELLALDGHRVAASREISRWRDDERAASPDIVVAAVAAPGDLLNVPLGGARGFAPPILFVERENDEVRTRHADERLIDRIASPFTAEELLARIDALVRVRDVAMRRRPSSETGEPPAASGKRFGGLLGAWTSSRARRLAKPKAPYLEVAARVAEWSDRRDGFEPGHADRVAGFAALIADELGLADRETGALVRAAMLHDIGKIALPIEVLRQTRPLEENQMRLVRTHAERGAAILRALDRDDAAADIILHHHEKVDGTGYLGCRGDAISRASRILAVAEGFDAMTTSLVRKRLDADAAIGQMRDLRGTQWDGECVDALVTALKPKPISISLD